MKQTIVAVLLLFPQSAFASSLSVEMTDTRKVYLRGPGCEEVKKEVESIQLWTKRRQEIPEDLIIHCEDDPYLRRVEITSILPKLVLEHYGVRPSCDGPNCWNWSLVESKLDSTLRYVESEEWKFYLEKYCRIRKIENNDPVQSGDVAAIRGRDQNDQINEIHGFISVGQLACTKNGYGNQNPYILQPIDQLFDAYLVSPYLDCRIGFEYPPSHCKTYVNFYQCSKEQGKSMEDMGDYHRLMNALAESNVIYEITSLRDVKSYRAFAKVKDKLSELSNIFLISSEIGQLRDVIVYSLRQQVSFFEWRV